MVPAILGAIGVVAWMLRPRRPIETGFEFVFVNNDGSVRELSPEERTYLTTKFAPGDSGRPYIKTLYEGRSLWGSRSGFIRRRAVPSHITIDPVHPNYDERVKALDQDPLASHRAAGDIITRNPDGSVLCSPNPALGRLKRWQLLRRHYLAEDRVREELARVESSDNRKSAAG
jgi:hypothetical protein